jgi:disulfide bond formation protein DsbB
MRVTRGLLLVLGIPAFFILTALSTLADTSPSPPSTASGAAPLPGDPEKGQTLFAQNCATCHGASLEGGIGPALNPIEKLPGVANPLDAGYLIGIITNGRTDNGRVMPVKGGNPSLTDQDVKDLAAYIIQQNRNPGGGALSPGELAKRTILWVSIGIIAMVFITYLLSSYNMRWIARRNAARRK